MRLIPGLEKDGKITVYIEAAGLPEIEQKIEETGEMGGEEAGAKEVIQRLGAVGDTITDVCGTIYNRIDGALKSGMSLPKDFSIEFAIKLGGKAGIPFVTEGSAEGTFKITAKWSV
jgi:hypothetical protein